MSDNLIHIGEAQAHYNTAYTRILKYSLEMYHEGLNEHKIISAPEIDMLENKATLQVQKWNDKWTTISLRKQKLDEKEVNYEEAKTRTDEAIKLLEDIDNILIHTLSIDDTVDWNTLKKKDKFPEAPPPKPEKKSYKNYPPKPLKESAEFIPQFTIIENIFRSKKDIKIREYELKYNDAISAWERQKSEIDRLNIQIDNDFKKN